MKGTLTATADMLTVTDDAPFSGLRLEVIKPTSANHVMYLLRVVEKNVVKWGEAGTIAVEAEGRAAP